VSENIRVRSILGRYLEHSRIFYFENSKAGQALMYAGSADWMPRNFYRRIEAVFPVEDPDLRAKLFHVLQNLLQDNVNARILRANGSYQKVSPKKITPPHSAQEGFMGEANALRQEQEQEVIDDKEP
jgi:polyphosphate kinase